MKLPSGYHWDSELTLGRETAALTAQVWPSYLAEEGDIPEPGLKFAISAEEFARRFPVWGIRQDGTGKLVAYAHAAQLAADLSQSALPNSGWRFAIQASATNEARNCLCLLVANVDPGARGLGLAQILIERAKQAARELGFDTLIAPVRPTQKQGLPFAGMTQYLEMRTENGESLDAWIRLHMKCGGRIVNVCSESVRVRASLRKWREWTGLRLQTSGDHILPQGLVPLKVDTYTETGTYCEPGVWVRYSI